MSKMQDNLGQVFHYLMMSGFFDENPNYDFSSEFGLLLVIIDNGNTSLKLKMHGDGTIEATARHLKLHDLYKRPPMMFEPTDAPKFIKAFLHDYYLACLKQQIPATFAA